MRIISFSQIKQVFSSDKIKKLKVIHCLHKFLPDQVAGTEVYTLSLIKDMMDKDVESIVLIPNFDSDISDEYVYDNIRVLRSAEPHHSDNDEHYDFSGLPFFISMLQKEKPDIVHFQELSGSKKGFTIRHVEAAKFSGAKVFMTMHLSSYSCTTGNLMYMNEILCDGIIDYSRCTKCTMNNKNVTGVQSFLLRNASSLVFNSGHDTTKWNNKIGTALGFQFLIKKRHDDLLKLAETCDGIIVLTKWYKSILLSNGVSENKLIYIPQALFIKNNFIKRKRTEQISETLKVVFVGRIAPFKGIHLIIEALKSIPENKISIDIYGSDTSNVYELECREQSKNMNNVYWKGVINNDDVIQMLSRYDALCLPSTFSEMSPLIIQEAFVAGIPVIASNVYGNAEQIETGKSGWLFQFKDSKDLAAQFKMLIQNPDLIKKAKEYLLDFEPFNKLGERYFELYNSHVEEYIH